MINLLRRSDRKLKISRMFEELHIEVNITEAVDSRSVKMKTGNGEYSLDTSLCMMEYSYLIIIF